MDYAAHPPVARHKSGYPQADDHDQRFNEALGLTPERLAGTIKASLIGPFDEEALETARRNLEEARDIAALAIAEFRLAHRARFTSRRSASAIWARVRR
jgi:hypothetical protein